MSQPDKTRLAAIAEIVDKIALELAFAKSGSDDSLLPINCLLAEIESLGAIDPALDEAICLVRKCVDRVFESTGKFDDPSLKTLGEWAGWLRSACDALIAGQAVPPRPASCAESPATTTAASAPEQAQETVSVSAELPLEMNIERDGELLKEFVNESQEHLQNIELGVLKLEEDPADAETLASIFRAFHTFKGGSGFLNLKPVNHLAHELESLLDLARQHKLHMTLPVINVILEGGDLLKQFVNEIEGQLSGSKKQASVVIPTVGLIDKVRAIIRGDVAVPAAASALKEKPAVVVQQSTAPSVTGDGNGAVRATASASVVKVDTLKLDSLIDLVGEMVIAQSQVVQDPDVKAIQTQRLGRNLAQLTRITGELQHTAMSLRMVPIRSTFQKMVRLVRDLAAKQDKQVELKMSGEETELDRTIVDLLSDPLIHMVRNSVDHGIEKPDVRKAKGKPEQGTVFLRAHHQGGSIVIEIEDDGAGLNKDRILAKAIEKGLVQKNEQLTDKEIYDLVFEAGFSTAEKVTDISGRGVGMDVVRRNIEKLRGKTEIESTLGKGSTFTIYLPLTLAIIDGLIVGIGDQRYIIPTLSVRESFRPAADMISPVQGRGEVVQVRGRLSPLLRLYEHFGVKPKTKDPTQAIVIVVGSERENRCLMVDEMIGKQEVVIKGLGETFKQTQGLAGAAIMGDGSVGLILDADSFVRLKPAAMQKVA